MLVPNRHGSSSAYRYGYQGSEKDNEVKGEGNSYDFGARMYDPRVGRWFVRDPEEKSFPSLTTYNSFANNPIIYIDCDGKKFVIPENLTKSQKLKVQFMLDVLKLTRPEIFEELDKSEINIEISVGIVSQEGVPDNMVLNGHTTFPSQKANIIKDKDGDWKTTDYETSIVKAYAINPNKYEKEYNDPEKHVNDLISITLEDANRLTKIDLKDGSVKILVNDSSDSHFLATIGGHEFGHAYFGIINPALNYIIGDLLKNAKGGHIENKPYGESHPSGIVAFGVQIDIGLIILKYKIAEYEMLEEKFQKELKEAEKEEKKEKKDKKSK
ncbi:RHS repeat domain-containing protein [Flavobacterium difficile]|uniref:RHS repeat-associated core domain-containing protein n=1 Tax=Flavobacterium difficile TaxID=2709659 RepID=A0ABX0I403_9FLAO|nr:RHS repeat-associated core domain-containing protein [Flavobacterium difficile]NHM00800.1 hypothetical protein [Flavobacterium difficile]